MFSVARSPPPPPSVRSDRRCAAPASDARELPPRPECRPAPLPVGERIEREEKRREGRKRAGKGLCRRRRRRCRLFLSKTPRAAPAAPCQSPLPLSKFLYVDPKEGGEREREREREGESACGRAKIDQKKAYVRKNGSTWAPFFCFSLLLSLHTLPLSSTPKAKRKNTLLPPLRSLSRNTQRAKQITKQKRKRKEKEKKARFAFTRRAHGRSGFARAASL